MRDAETQVELFHLCSQAGCVSINSEWQKTHNSTKKKVAGRHSCRRNVLAILYRDAADIADLL